MEMGVDEFSFEELISWFFTEANLFNQLLLIAAIGLVIWVVVQGFKDGGQG